MITQLIALVEIVTGIQGVSGLMHGRKRWDVDDRVRGDRHVNVISILTPDKLSKIDHESSVPQELRGGWVGGLARSGSTRRPTSDNGVSQERAGCCQCEWEKRNFFRHVEEIHKFAPWSSCWGAVGKCRRTA